MNLEQEHPARVVIIGYAFKSLDPQQAQAVEAHLATCPHCRALVALYLARSEKPPEPEQAVEPPVQLQPEKPPESEQAVEPPVQLQPEKPPELEQAVEPPAQPPARLASSDLPTRPLPSRPKAPWMRLDWLHATLALAVLVLLVANVLQLIQARTMRDEQTDLLRTIQANQVINALASEAGIELVPISGPQGQGSLLYEKDGTSGILFLRNLPPLDASHTYQAWFIPPSGSPINAGAFHPNAGTPFASVLLNADRPIRNFLAINVTVEPVAGSRAPSATPILVVRF
jgi:hypothetical protein